MNILMAEIHNENCRYIKRVPMRSAVAIRALMTDLVELCGMMRIQTKKAYHERRDQVEALNSKNFESRRIRSRNQINSTDPETCIHCGITMQMQNYRKYHGDRCKLNPNRFIK